MWADWGGMKMEMMDGIRANMAIMQAAGGIVIMHSDDASGSQRLNQEAAKAMAAGHAAGINITEEDAIKWMTINPAWAIGLDDKIGSLVAGKNADVVLWSGDPFSVYTRAEKVWVDGAMLFDRSDPKEQWRTDFELGYRARQQWRIQLMRAQHDAARGGALRADRMRGVRGAQTIAITGGTVYPVSGPKIEHGTVLIANGKVAAVGANVPIPAGATRIDATGKWVTPGLFNAATTLGLAEGNPASGGYNESRAKGEKGVAASFNAWEGMNPASTFIPATRKDGITTAMVAPGGGNIISGRAAIVDLNGETVASMLVRAPVAMVGELTQGTDARGEQYSHLRTILSDAKVYGCGRSHMTTARFARLRPRAKISRRWRRWSPGRCR